MKGLILRQSDNQPLGICQKLVPQRGDPANSRF
nr:MAG TPA: hypothetical protein [Bacteriophage sp.]